ncbi:MBL fold metallo-hydrolase [Frankia sp. R82]|uniref:MBL fold metallo-hydrolase n=1 Tax=Frankia sp. R82 TaxID=2950553 RepID=UPI0020444BFD|nr:MBL fold metallo-hydrolase [Frankia sp. R82]MCM3882293.1 MBL fold metallo-hydrolase [Frankia sp. R82]
MMSRANLELCLIGGPTVVLQIGGLRLVTDPTFDEPGEYPVGSRKLVKLTGPALPPGDLDPADAILLSHDQHPDNLDVAGAAYLAAAPVTLTTGAAAERLGPPARRLDPWQQVELVAPGGRSILVTGLPAQHGPDGTEHLTGPVVGFLLSGSELPTVYISGDNASLPVVHEIADRVGSVDVAIVHAGAARTPLVGDATLTVSSAEAVEVGRVLGATTVIPVHFEGWTHFSEGAVELERAFAAAGESDRLVLPGLGERITV